MQVIAWPGGEPFANCLVVVGAVIVQNDVNRQIFGDAAVNFAEEFQELLMAVTRLAIGDDTPVQQVQGSK